MSVLVEGHLHKPENEPPAPIRYEAGWAPEEVWMMWRGDKSCSYRDLNSDSSAVQPLANHYTDWAIPAQISYAYDNTKLNRKLWTYLETR
jgi:hypothetical protein